MFTQRLEVTLQYLGVTLLKCHFYLSIQVSSFLTCWWYPSNYTPVSIIKQNPAEICLCAYQVFNRALVLSDTSMQIRQHCPCKNHPPWLENSLLQHLGRPQHITLFPPALTLIVWLLVFSFCQSSKLVVASKMIVFSCSKGCSSLAFRPSSWLVTLLNICCVVKCEHSWA